MKVAVLGANGQLGRDICQVFEKKQINYIAVTRKEFDLFVDPVDKLNFLTNVNYIINCIGYTNVDQAEMKSKKAFETNSLFVYELVRFCEKNSIVLFYISTDYVFDGNKNAPYKEGDYLNPINIYGISKAAGEFAVRNYLERYFIFRVSSLFGVAGASGKGGNFVETMVKLAKEGKELEVIDSQIMSPTHTLDVARAVATFIDKKIDNYGIYHCCNSGSCNWYEFAKTIFELTSIEANLKPVSMFPTKAKRPKYSVLDNGKITRYFKVKGWKEALKEYLELKRH